MRAFPKFINGPHIGLVEANADPQKLGRLKVRATTIYGAQGELPWAIPFGLPAGGTANSGGVDWVPNIGDQVILFFLDGEPEKPVWSWCMQTTPQQQKFPLHEYDPANKAPDRAAFTKYGHTVELTANTVNVTTKQGYQVVLDDSTGSTGGSAILNTPEGQTVQLSDLSKTAVLQATDTATIIGDTTIVNGGTNLMLIGNANICIMGAGILLNVNGGAITLTTESGASFIIDPDGNAVLTSANGDHVSVENNKLQVATADGTSLIVEPGQVSVNAAKVMVNATTVALGQDAVSSITLTDPLSLWLNTHIHSNGDNGSPTGPPIVPVLPQEIGSNTAMSS